MNQIPPKVHKLTEAELEQAIIEQFVLQGYTFIHGTEIHRNRSDVLLQEDLKSFLNQRYANERLSENETQRIINQICLIPSLPLYAGNREAFWRVNEGFDLVRDDIHQIALHIDFIDFENPEKNIFKIVNQFSVEDKQVRRPDLLIFINGIPIGICEFKSAIEESTTIHDAWQQIFVRYRRDIPKLMKYCFLSVISDGANTRLGSIFTPYEYYYSWNKVNDTEKVFNGLSSLFTLIAGAFAKDRILALLRDFIFYPDDSKKEEAIVCRYPQFFGARKMLKNLQSHLRPQGDGKGGTYFGATGCGKTYTMLFLSRLVALRDCETFNNPTIIVLTDREDLDTQTSELFVTARKYLHEQDVRSIESRNDLQKTLRDKPSGGIYITTIQKFCDTVGLLSDRNNILCISDEAHRTQLGLDAKLKTTEEGLVTTYGFAKYLRDSFPNATYCGFTGTPIDETISVFGTVVDSYTMKESSDDGITVRIAYEPRLARALLSDDQALEIQQYYEQCSQEGAAPEQIEKSKRAMSRMAAILGHPDRLKKLANDIVQHYETLCDEKPRIVQKAMVVCTDRQIAFNLLKEILTLRPGWGEKRRAEDESVLSSEQLEKLLPLPRINLVATRTANDRQDLYEICGTKEYRKLLDKQFKNLDSNFKIAIVVDMWITGFDVPSLAVMYLDKPLQKHTLIQTISRVNRVFEGKDKGLVVDYIGIRNKMLEAIKQYGEPQENPVDELNVSLSIFRNHLSLIDESFYDFNAGKFYSGTPRERLECLNLAAEYVQTSHDREVLFQGLSRRLKSAYQICFPTGKLTVEETSRAQFYLAVRSLINKQTQDNTPDAEIMNRVVEEMVQNAIICTGIENIVNEQKSVDLFSDEFLEQLKAIKLPISQFNALLKLLRKAIQNYAQINKVKAMEFAERLRGVIEKYNNRDKLVFTSAVVSDFVNDLSNQLIQILRDQQEDQNSFKKLGITYEEKAFYDILIKVRDTHKFPYADEKCLILAQKIKNLVDDQIQFADWSTRDDIKSALNMQLTILLYQNGYPPDWNQEVFEKVLEQAENFKKHTT